MKTKIIGSLLTAGILALTASTQAQTSWDLVGNSNATSSNFIGTTNNIPLKFKTKNVVRMYIGGTGKIGIGTSAPSSQLEVFGAATLLDPVIRATVKYTGTDDVIAIEGTSTVTDTTGIGVRGIGNLIGVNGQSNIVGVEGDGYYGVYGYANYTGSTTSEQTGVFGDAIGGNVANGLFGIATNSTQNISVWGVATDTATVGGIRDYAGYFQGNVFGYRFFQLSDERMKKNITPLTSVLSRLMNVKTATYNYKSSEYPGLHLPAGLQTGFLAENLDQLFPDMVVETVMPEKKNNKTGEVICTKENVKVVNYMGMIPVLTAAIQEQQKQIEAKDVVINTLQNQLASLESRLSKLESVTNSVEKTGAVINNATLDQNTPNPFNGYTVINYNLPDNTTSAKLMITAVNGQLIREISLNGKGKGQVQLQANELNAGSYLYSLYVNGQMVDTKTLLLSK